MRLTSRLALGALAGTLVLAVAAPVQAAPTQAHRGPSVAATPQGDHVCRQDRRFLVAAHQSNLAEILGGHLALLRSQRADVRHIAQVLIEDHTRLDADVRATARRYGVALPATPSARQTGELLAVAVRPAAEFDYAWLRLQEVSHLRTLALIDRELAYGCARAVRALARAAEPVVQHHLDMVRMALDDS